MAAVAAIVSRYGWMDSRKFRDELLVSAGPPLAPGIARVVLTPPLPSLPFPLPLLPPSPRRIEVEECYCARRRKAYLRASPPSPDDASRGQAKSESIGALRLVKLSLTWWAL